MPKGNFLTKNWQSELVSLRQSLSAYDDNDPECVHKIRVSIKKLRAYLKLYYFFCRNKDAKDLFYETDALFLLLGKHRDIEIARQKVNEIYRDFGYLAWLQRLKEELPSIRDAVFRFKGAELDQLTKAINEAMVHSANPAKQIITIRNRLLKKVKASLRRFKRNFHQIRKDLKNMYYLIKISFSETEFSEKKLNRLNKILDLLGNIQDEEVALEFIRRYQSASLIRPDTGVLRAAGKNIKLKKREALKKANKRTSKFLRASR